MARSKSTRPAAINLALRGIEADFGPEHVGAFHPDLRADYAGPTSLSRANPATPKLN